MKSASAEFVLGEAFKETTIDGRKMTTTFSVELVSDENGAQFVALVQTQIDSDGRNIKVIRFIRDDVLNVIMKVGDTSAFAYFESVSAWLK